jgi:hypothetical protein
MVVILRVASAGSDRRMKRPELTGFERGVEYMRQLLLVGTAVLAFTTTGLPARATPIDFTYTGSLVDFTVPTTGTYQILAFGAQGGNALGEVGTPPGPGGMGAEIGGDFSFFAREVLQIAVGGVGGTFTGGAGGGGGSFVVGPGNMPLVIAGGGGGGGAVFGGEPFSIPGGDGQITTSGG